jgi:hypothetical protein
LPAGSAGCKAPALSHHIQLLALHALIVRRSVVRSRRSGGALRLWLGCSAEMRKLRPRKVERTCHDMVWRGEREPPSKTGTRQRFEQADRVVVQAFADLHEARRLKRNQFPGTLCNGSSVRLGIG